MPKKRPPTPPKPAFIDLTPSVSAYPARLGDRTEIQYARLLGMSIVAWSYAEEALTLILAVLLGVDHTRAEIVFYASKSEQFRVDLIRQLAKRIISDEALMKSLNDALSAFLRLVGQRNTYVHGLWKYNDRGHLEIIPTKAGPVDWFSPRGPVTTADIKEFIDKIWQAEVALLSAHSTLISSFYEKSRKLSVRRTQPTSPPPKSSRVRRRSRPRSSSP